MIDPLLQPLTIGSQKIDNRIFMPAMHLNMCRNFEVTEKLIEFYKRRSEGGAGLISTGYATVDELSGNGGNIGAHDDRFLPGLNRLAEAIHLGGAKAAVQLNHAGRYNHSALLGGRAPIAPSPIASRLTGETPREMTEADIAAVQQSFALAAQRVVDAGFDIVEILAGTGYLISEFLSPLTNTRTDSYGGPLTNRMRFGLEIVRSIRSQIGNVPILVRINGNDFMYGGNGRQELHRFAVALAEQGADALCVNVGWHEAKVPQIVTKVPRGVFAYMAREIRNSVNIPVIASHRINDPATGRRLIGEGFCDMVAMGRALIADPDLPRKVKEGQERDILHCVACGQGCFDNLVRMKQVECLCNPLAGHEQEYRLEPGAGTKRVIVAGGGPAGMNAALVAAARGHQVSLYEKSMRLGGQLHLAGASPGREEFRNLAADLVRKIWNSNVRVVLNTEVDGPLLQTEQPDLVIAATGGKPITPTITGASLDHVVQAWDVLQDGWLLGERIIIIGGGAVGVETALLVAQQGTLSAEELKFLFLHDAEPPDELKRLALEGTRKVTLVEMEEKLGSNFGKSTRWSMLQDLGRHGVDVRAKAVVEQIGKQEVVIRQNGEQVRLEADTVVLAVGTSAFNPVEKIAMELGVDCKVVGDAQQPATVMAATHQGFRAGYEVV